MSLKTICSLLLLVCFHCLLAQSICVENSEFDATIIIPASANIQLNDEPVPYGTIIQVLFREGDQMKCGGFTVGKEKAPTLQLSVKTTSQRF